MLLIDAEQKRDEYQDRLRFKVDALKRKEEDLLVWEDEVANREWKLENSEDNLTSMMRELRLKDILLADKNNTIKKKDRELEDQVRQARADVRREVEVCYCVICGVNVLLRTSNVFMAAIRGPMMTVTRCVSV